MTTSDTGPNVKPETKRSDEYHILKEAIEAFQEVGDLPPQDDIWRAVADILAADLRERFRNHVGVDQPAETACIRRLITGEEECSCSERMSWIDRARERIGARDDPPHQPPHSDHPTLWLDEEGEPAVYSMHVYPGNVTFYTPSKTVDPDQQRRNGWFDIIDWAEHWGLDVDVIPVSWYNPFSTVNVIFYPPERY